MKEQPERPSTAGRPAPAGAFVAVILAGVWTWWAWEQGAWFGVVLLPGAIVLCASLAVLALVAPSGAGALAGRAAAVALGALIALGAWAALSALWSPAPDIAIADGQRTLVYALAFGLGLWMAALLGRARAALTLVPLTVAGGFAATVTAAMMLTGADPATLLEADGTLELPLGYRNANAAFYAIAFFAALGLATDPAPDWRLRGAALAVATLCVGSVMLSQSRGSIPAALIALVVYVIAAPVRLRAICWLALAVLPALVVVPTVGEVYRVSNDLGVAAAGDALAAAGAMLAASAALSLSFGLGAARLDGRLPGFGSTSGRGNRPVLAALAVGLVAAAATFALAVGNPGSWLGERADEFRAGTPDLSEQGSRFSFNLGTDRYDLWRVAIADARADPLQGTGSGGFEYSYLRERESQNQTARDAHSVQLELVGELGVPGLALLLAALGGSLVGVLRARRAGPGAAALTAAALGAGAYWLAHASIDWLWAYPAITAPIWALLGSACAAGGSPSEPRAPRPGARIAIVVVAAALALSAIPPFLAERYVNQAYAGWRVDIERAYADLGRAQALNPLSDVPLLAEGAIAAAADDRARAIGAFRRATEKRPEEWAGHFLLAELLAGERPAVARRELERARELNPNSLEIDELEANLGAPPRPGD